MMKKYQNFLVQELSEPGSGIFYQIGGLLTIFEKTNGILIHSRRLSTWSLKVISSVLPKGMMNFSKYDMVITCHFLLRINAIHIIPKNSIGSDVKLCCKK